MSPIDSPLPPPGLLSLRKEEQKRFPITRILPGSAIYPVPRAIQTKASKSLKQFLIRNLAEHDPVLDAGANVPGYAKLLTF
jgi:hypothetical protein